MYRNGLTLIGANRGGQALTEEWVGFRTRPATVMILDRTPGRAETLASLWRNRVGVEELLPRLAAGDVLDRQGTPVEQWAIDDPAALARGLSRPLSTGQVRQWGVQLTSPVPMTGFSQPVIGLGGTMAAQNTESISRSQALLDVLRRLSRRTTSRDITRDQVNDFLLRPVRNLVWKENMRRLALLFDGPDAEPGPEPVEGLFVARTGFPGTPPLYPLLVEQEDTSSRHLLRARARDLARREGDGRFLAAAFVNPERQRIFFVFLARGSRGESWSPLWTLELPPPEVRRAVARDVLVTD